MVRPQELDDFEAALLTSWVRAGLWLQPDLVGSPPLADTLASVHTHVELLCT